MTTTRSINLSEHEVRATLDDRLGLVVRPVSHKLAMCFDTPRGPEDVAAGYPMVEDEYGDFCKAVDLCPLGVPGTRLVCKETYRRSDKNLPDGIFYPASSLLRYFDGNEDLAARRQIPGMPRNGRNRSPATMPAWASRITLEVVGVRVRRCGDLTYEDAENSGVADASLGTRGMSPLTVLRDLWNRRYGRRYPWESSPWVWKVEVKRVEA